MTTRTDPLLKVDIQDYRGVRVVFKIRKWESKSVQHPELCDPAFIVHIKEALQNPTEVWEDYDGPSEKNCYYKRFGINLYAKVVVLIAREPNEVISAFEVDYVKETKYPSVRKLR